MIVVGVDGSASSRDAIRWAVKEARARKTGVRAVYAWQLPIVIGFAYIPPEVLDPKELARCAKQVVDAAVAEAVAARDGVEIESVALEGVAAETLVKECAEADMLVVGSRGRGGFSGLLLGSVGQQCVHHAACPVVIVRPAPDGQTERSES
jgi:nucleotide-binding universal stress UspA family protein